MEYQKHHNMKQERIGKILEMLEHTKNIDNNEFIAIAKGKYALPKTWRGAIHTARRTRKAKKD